MVSLSSRSPFISLFSVPPILTPADTDQVASSQWVSMEPSNRKQVRTDAPASMLNVAVKKHWALFWPCQATSAQDLVRGAGEHFCLRSLFQHLWCECVSVADVVGRSCQVYTHRRSSEHYWQGHLGVCVYEREGVWLTPRHCFTAELQLKAQTKPQFTNVKRFAHT